MLSPAQEKKLDDVYDAMLRVEGKFNLNDVRMAQHREAILDQQKQISATKNDLDTRLEILEADRNKVVGAIWVTCSSAFAACLAFVVSWFRK